MPDLRFGGEREDKVKERGKIAHKINSFRRTRRAYAPSDLSPFAAAGDERKIEVRPSALSGRRFCLLRLRLHSFLIWGRFHKLCSITSIKNEAGSINAPNLLTNST